MAGPRGCQVKAETQTKPPKHFGTDGIGQFRRERQALKAGEQRAPSKQAQGAPGGGKKVAAFTTLYKSKRLSSKNCFAFQLAYSSYSEQAEKSAWESNSVVHGRKAAPAFNQ